MARDQDIVMEYNVVTLPLTRKLYLCNTPIVLMESLKFVPQTTISFTVFADFIIPLECVWIKVELFTLQSGMHVKCASTELIFAAFIYIL